MTVTIRQFVLTSLAILLLISCNSDGDGGYSEPSNKKNIGGENIVSNNNFDKDLEFAEIVAENSLLEMRLAALTINRSSSDTIKSFAVSLMTDQAMLNNDVQGFAETRGITLTTTLSLKSQKKYDALAGKSAGEFDEAYCAFLVREREEVLTRFKNEAETGNDPELKDWAARKIVALEQHLLAAKGLSDMKE